MKYIDNILWLEYREVVGSGVSENTLKRAKARASASWVIIDDPADKRCVLVQYDCLKQKYKDLIIAKYGEPAEYLRAQQAKQKNNKLAMAKHSLEEAASQHYKPEIYEQLLAAKVNGAKIKSADAHSYAVACQWLEFCQSKWYKKAGFSSKTDFLQTVVEHLTNNPLKGLKISNTRYLQRKVQQYLAEGANAVVNGMLGKKNREKLNKLQKMFLLDRYSSHLKPTIPVVHQIYTYEAQQRNWPMVCESTIKNYLFSTEVKQKWFLARHGEDFVKRDLERVIKRQKASFPDAIWSMDGTDIPLVYKDGRGKEMKSQLYLYLIHDVCSDAILGHSIGVTETAVLIQAALRAAIRRGMKRAYQLQYDNGKANLANEVKQLAPKLSKIGFPTMPHNGKSKPVENLIKRLQQTNMRHFDNFRGGNRTSPSLQIKANADKVGKMNLPTLEEAIDQMNLSIEIWNNTAGKDGLTPLERYSIPHEKRQDIGYLSMVDIFWVKRQKQATYTKNGLTIEVEKTKYTYEVETERGVEDMEFRLNYLGDAFDIVYDPDDLTTINLYQNGQWITTANQKYEAPMAIADYKPGDGKIIQAGLDQKKAYVARLRAEAEAVRSEMEDEGIEELSYKHIHKDAMNRIEGNELLKVLDRERPKPRRQTLYGNAKKATGAIIQ